MLSLLGFASGIAGNDVRTGNGPLFLEQHPELFPDTLNYLWYDVFAPEHTTSNIYETVASICRRLAQRTFELTQDHTPFVTIGGDHSSAIGTWSGVAEVFRSEGPLGLIWIDAHLDAHTPETSLTGNIHGMPLAALLGYGDPRLTHLLSPIPKFEPEHVCVIGARSCEPEEAALLERLKVRVYFMEEVKQRGLSTVLQEARAHILANNAIAYGLTIDIDSVDPVDAPGVSTPAADGLSGAGLIESLKTLADRPPCAAEITEYNPSTDKEQKTAKLVVQLIETLQTYWPGE